MSWFVYYTAIKAQLYIIKKENKSNNYKIVDQNTKPSLLALVVDFPNNMLYPTIELLKK